VITGFQIRRARELLGWRQAELARKCGIAANVVESAESSEVVSFVPIQHLDAMRKALEAAGVEFTNDNDHQVKLKLTTAG
jgi:ribosome-binding protein aMBF1 (putative translation factor)